MPLCSALVRPHLECCKEGIFRLDVSRKFLALFIPVVRSLVQRLPREHMDAPSMKMFKGMLDGALSNLILRVVSLPMSGGIELGDL